MKQYVLKGSGIFSSLQLQYEGGWFVNGGFFYYDGEGMFYHSRNDYYKALFDKGKELKRNIGFINEAKIKEFIK